MSSTFPRRLLATRKPNPPPTQPNSTQLTIPTLHNLSSSQSLRVLWALEELTSTNSLKYKLKNYPRVHGPAPPELKSIFPLGKSPILTIEPVNEGEPVPIYQLNAGVLTESRLILQFLSDTYSNGAWEPLSAQDKRRDEFFQEFANNTFAMKVSFALLFDVIPPRLPFPFQQIAALMVRPVVNFWINDLQTVYQLMEDSLWEEKPWFSGERLGLADFCMSWGMDLAVQRGYFDDKKYPKVAKWYKTVTERPAYKRALEKGGSYDLINFDM
ncbi:putative glutathione S-transferase [Zopfia rhizophila CBS 207.26]|uniref:Putative glutathione S-transferase n=1 Tax=Zopfia rhizophila CBS 207.26 TaxID=1314779 RepID=A0A6A6DM20_9PEZI|nr:putative glutathione S-transferase [Zopfia rhizophila CBS 207.26]